MVPYPWYRGRVMIMGDAAHAMTPYLGSGAAMAIEDGVVFAQLLDSDDPCTTCSRSSWPDGIRA